MKRQFGYLCSLLAGLILIAGVTPDVAAAMSVSLSPSIPSPAPVGTIVTWSATVSDAGPGTLWYRFRARPAGADFRMVRDYGPPNSLDWTASESEGTYEIEVSVKNQDTQETSVASAVYQMTSRVTDNTPVISPTANPLVLLYSAPPCPVGGQMRVQFEPPFQSPGNTVVTPSKPCQEGLSMNFYLAGMQPNSEYWVQHTIETGEGFVNGPVMTLATPDVSLPISSYSVLRPPQGRLAGGVLLQSTLFETTVATDLYGNPIWFYPGDLSFLTRPQRAGLFFGIVEIFGADQSHQILREFDLAGTTIRETNAARINEQLAASGKPQINAFHHEARELPDGGVLVLADTEQIMNDVQGPGPVDIIGDMILVLDRDLQVVWTWDAFDHLDASRTATLGETCTGVGSGCPPYYMAQQANDWLHGNSLQLTPDGNILYSTRHQDWLIKIDYRNGAGSGDIMWRLGKDGDFRIDSKDPYPWFSHQHDARFEFGDNSTLMVFDDGNVRNASDPKANSRGQVYQLDEVKHIARLVLNADLGGYSRALGSAQKLPNGHYHFDLGWLPDNSSQSVEVDSAGNIVYAIQTGTPEYRSFRMNDLYTPYVTQPVTTPKRPIRKAE